jgi:hypothetical protein
LRAKPAARVSRSRIVLEIGRPIGHMAANIRWLTAGVFPV